MGLQTALYQEHVSAGAKIVDFAGYDMPLHYGSQLDEHHQVRKAAGMFDVSHMCIVDLAGARVRDFLRYLLANDVDKLSFQGKALYSCMLTPEGGVIDDLIVYLVGDNDYRMVVNAGTREKDLAWLRKQAGAFDVSVKERDQLSMIAVQGPRARELASPLLPGSLPARSAELKRFSAAWQDQVFVARTGYTGEDGFEIILPHADAVQLWRALAEAGVAPIGLGARDTLRLEAGMNLYGSDMDEGTTPLESGLGWTVAWKPAEREFIGRPALDRQKAEGAASKLVGLVLVGKGVLRDHQVVRAGDAGEGEITSGGFAPSLGRSIAFARLPAGCGDEVMVDIRGRDVPARVVKPPFVREGEALV